ncbi:hypothetical protein NQZ68_008413 [Dissostichus eleginoides]|nr:hypothetical protein NQZ68_008413 [Dissostichus eleginoides]
MLVGTSDLTNCHHRVTTDPSSISRIAQLDATAGETQHGGERQREAAVRTFSSPAVELFGVQGSVQQCPPSPPLPADHVLHSAAVLFPGAFDQHGCPLIVFPLEEQAKLSSELSKAEVVDFINYFLSLHNRKQEKEGLVSVVADLRHASLQTSRFIAETLLLLEGSPACKTLLARG